MFGLEPHGGIGIRIRHSNQFCPDWNGLIVERHTALVIGVDFSHESEPDNAYAQDLHNAILATSVSELLFNFRYRFLDEVHPFSGDLHVHNDTA